MQIEEAGKIKKKKTKISLKSPTQERSRQTVTTILEACARILVREGFFGVTTDKIAKEAGVSIGSLYQFFGNKESVVSALIQNMMETDIAAFQEKMANIGQMPAEARIQRMVEIGLEVFRTNSELRSKIQTIQLYLTDTGFFLNSMKFYQEMITNNLPELAGRDRQVVSYVCVSAFTGLLNAAAMDNKVLADEPTLVSEITRLFNSYLKA